MAKKPKTQKKVDLEKWHWPFQRINFGGDREYSCPHGIGHGGIHGCDGCCAASSFPRTKVAIEWDEDGEQELYNR